MPINNVLNIIALLFGLMSVGFFITAIIALKKRKICSSGVGIIFSLLMFSLSALFVTIAISTQGYRALTREEVAATIIITPTDSEWFRASFTFPDGRKATYWIAGEEIYIDAHILKWKPIVNIIGFHTLYELDRVAGRYGAIEDEKKKTRTVYKISQNKTLDMFNLRRQYAFLKPLVDTEYGSATFIKADKPSTFEVRVSITGLLIRKLKRDHSDF